MKKTIKKILKESLSPSSHRVLKKKYWWLREKLHKRSLTELAILYNSDKWGGHYYTPHYEHHFWPFKDQKICLLELGIGGYEHPEKGGASLRMWKSFFKKAQVNGIDIYNKSKIDEKRIKTFIGSQDDEKFLKGVIDKTGKPDIIIDDGSHLNSHVIKSFEILFSLLKEGGIYVVEDIQTSYWPSYGGNSENMEDKRMAINYFRDLVHGLNHEEIIKENYKKSYFDLNIISIHFYHNLIFIYKGKNNEPSNMVRNNKL